MSPKLPTPGRPGAPRSLREATRLPAIVATAPGEAPRPVTVGQAVDAARRAMAADAFEVAQFIGDQLRRVPGATLAALLVLLEASTRLGRAGDAHVLAQRLLDIGVEDPDDVLVLAHGLQLTSRHAQALALLGAALARAPRDARLRHLRAELLGEAGEQAAAVAELRALLRQEPRHFASYRSLALLDRLTEAEVAFLERGPIPPAGRIPAFSALAFEYRARGDPAREFHWLDQAQALLAQADPWFPAEETEAADQLIARLDGEFFARAPAAAAGGGRRPVFILGMPRSGSTLAEQILVSAHGVGAAGESGIFPWLLLDLARRRYGEAPYPDIALRLDAGDVARLRADYLETVSRVYTQAPVFVDKQFTNWKYVGLLKLVLPEALFVHTVRDPLDTCLSAYQQCFHSLGYGHSLEHLALLLRDQARVMAHWRSLFPDSIHELGYERLVAGPEAEIRRLLAFCGIPWTERALRFHETKRDVRTASVAQVRRPLYASSVGKAAAYGALLDPARRILGA
jgi:tetratricopeptide (TPR) repeat protein